MRLFLLSLSLLIACVAAATKPTTIWEKCATINNVNYCVSLTQAGCQLDFKVTTLGGFITVFEKPLDLSISPQVCSTLPASNCLLCVGLENITKTDQTVNACVAVTESCSHTDTPLGCFENSNKELVQCLAAKCPNGCSGNGKCGSDGKCACNLGWFGADCSNNQIEYNQCIKTSMGEACLNAEFEDCAIKTTLTLSSIPIYSKELTVPEFNTYFGADQCVTALSCRSCLSWKDFTLNTTYMQGCPSLNLTCGNTNYGPFDFDCIRDTNIVPACFGDCSKNCSNHGTCSNAWCTCNSDYQGPTCAIPKCDKVNYCSGNGVCVSPNFCQCNDGWGDAKCATPSCDGVGKCSGNGKCIGANKCQCDSGFTGDSCSEATCTNICYNGGECVKAKCKCADGWKGADCSTKKDKSSKGDDKKKSGGNSGSVALGVCLGVGITAAVGGGAFFLYRRHRAQRTGALTFDDGLLSVPSESQ